MIIKCPHCHLKVLPKKDNTCPSCGNNVSDISTDVEYDLVELKYEQKLPDVCIICGESTNDKVKVNYSHRYGSKNNFIVKLFAQYIVLLILMLIFYLILPLILDSKNDNISHSNFMIFAAISSSILVLLINLFLASNQRCARIMLFLPACKNCSKKERLKPKYIDFANSSVTFVAHKNFIDAFHK